MSKTLKEQLNNVFINGRGEVCSNLETTRSKAGSELRKHRDEVEDSKTRRQEAAKARKRLRELRSMEREMEKRIKTLRAEGMQHGAGTEECARCFSEANNVNDELRGVRKGIRKLNKKLHK
ncbi:MAG: hypothetical protein ACWGQW_11220 [bacterium]